MKPPRTVENPRTIRHVWAACEAMARGESQTQFATREWWAQLARIMRRHVLKVTNPNPDQP